jgi:hypothetical protein
LLLCVVVSAVSAKVAVRYMRGRDWERHRRRQMVASTLLSSGQQRSDQVGFDHDAQSEDDEIDVELTAAGHNLSALVPTTQASAI